MNQFNASDIPFDDLMLPSMPAVAMRLMEECENPDADVHKLARIVSDDQSLSARYLKVANSAYTGWRRKIGTMGEAFVVLGIKSVKTLALGFTLVSSLSDRFGDTIDMDRLWQRSLIGALGAQHLAKTTKRTDPEEAFLAGLLRDIGILAMVSYYGSDYMQVYKMSDENHRSLAPAERIRYGFDHAEVGAELACHWSMPDALVDPIRYHETCPEKLEPGLGAKTQMVHAAARLPDVLMKRRPDDEIREFFACIRDCMGLSREVAEETIRHSQVAFKEVAPLFDVKRGEMPDVSVVLNRANKALLEISLDHQRLAEELEAKNKELARLVGTDSLTGIQNRGAFDQALSKAFTAAKQSGEPVSVVLLDADHFKSVNDTHGHAMGDEVLRRIAGTVTELLPSPACGAYRYGGEEIASLLPGLSLEKAVLFAERVRTSVERLEMSSEGGEAVAVTVSAGVATFTGNEFASAESLFKAADDATYAAKKAGRNTVRVSRRPAAPSQAMSA